LLRFIVHPAHQTSPLLTNFLFPTIRFSLEVQHFQYITKIVDVDERALNSFLKEAFLDMDKTFYESLNK
jgi:hypothetical protein